MENRPFIYDPSRQVEQTAKKVSDSVKDIWKPIIQEKLNAYQAVSDDLENIEKIKSNLKGVHTEFLTNRFNTIQSELANSIGKNGKIDNVARAKVQSDILQAKNLYTKAQQSEVLVEQALQTLKDSGDAIVDVVGTRNQIYSMMRDPKYMLSGSDLTADIKKVIGKNTNFPYIMQKRAAIALEPTAKIVSNRYINESGDLVVEDVSLVRGTKIDEKTHKIVIDEEEYKKMKGEGILALSEDEINGWKGQLGASTAFGASVEQNIEDNYKNSVLSSSKVVKRSMKTKDELELAALKTQDLKNKTSPEKVALELKNLETTVKQKEAGINNDAEGLSLRRQGLGLQAEDNALARKKFTYEQNNPKEEKVGKIINVVSDFQGGSKGVKGVVKVGGTEKAKGFGFDKNNNFFLLQTHTKGGLKPVFPNKNEVASIINSMDGDMGKDARVMYNQRFGNNTNSVAPKGGRMTNNAGL